MSPALRPHITATTYNRADCAVGVVHLGFGAFHRAHQAVYLDDHMQMSGDLRWGIAAVNLRASEAAQFQITADDVARHDGYFLKSFSADDQVALRRVRAHVQFFDWTTHSVASESLLSQESVHLVTITVTESGYYTDADGDLNTSDQTIMSETNGGNTQSVYGYLRAALNGRMLTTNAPLTIACCDNIRQNGQMLHRNLLAYLLACDDQKLANWVQKNVAFPCSMVDRITPRSEPALAAEISLVVGTEVTSPVMAEDFIQWVLQDTAKAEMPDLARVGVTVAADIDPYEETKIRVLNGGHTGLTYLAALEGVETFDAAMHLPHLRDHFDQFEIQEVLAALTLDLPFSKIEYLASIAQRFSNAAIGDTVARICADGMAKFPTFIRPTLQGCLEQDILPTYTIRSIASWYVFACHVAAGKIAFKYVEPNWVDLERMLGNDTFVTSRQLWGNLPETYPEFAVTLRREITELEAKWPI